MKLNTRKRRGLLVLLFVLVSIVALLVYMFFSNPVIDETFIFPPQRRLQGS